MRPKSTPEKSDPDLPVKLTLTIAECMVVTALIEMVVQAHKGQAMDHKFMLEIIKVAHAIDIAATKRRIHESVDRAEALQAAIAGATTRLPA